MWFKNIKNWRKIGLLILTTLLPQMAIALPVCQDVFTKPYTGGHQLQNLNFINIINNAVQFNLDFFDCFVSNSALTCQDRSHNLITQQIRELFYQGGDYAVRQGHFIKAYGLDIPKTVHQPVRLYFDALYLNDTTLNHWGNAQDLIIYVKNHLEMSNNSHINGIVYVGGKEINGKYIGGEVNISANSSIDGAFAAGTKNLSFIQGKINFNQNALNTAASRDSLLNMCSTHSSNTSFTMDFGTASSNVVSFKHAFSNGVQPLVFLMPNIRPENANSNGPASAFITSITQNGFTWQQKSPPNTNIPVKPMQPISWIAVTPGLHTLSTDKGNITLHAGSIDTDEAIINNQYYEFDELDFPKDLDVVLNQLQTTNNHCWLTSTGIMEKEDDEVEVALGLNASQVKEGEQCKLGKLKKEEIAYLAVPSGSGTLHLNGEKVSYDFQTKHSAIGTVQQQCDATQNFQTKFKNSPTLVASKNSRGKIDMFSRKRDDELETAIGDGGWLRRCKLSANNYSMVVDEDTNADRIHHHHETYSYIALGDANRQPDNCFIDDFNRSKLGNNWAAKIIDNSEIPHIVDDERLRLTSTDKEKQSASITLQKLFPSKNNHIVIEFDYYAWRQPTKNEKTYKGGDGLGLVLSDSAVTPQPGAIGGALGYTPLITDTRDHSSTINFPGFAGGWLGIGFDTTGNFSNPDDGGKNGGIGNMPQSIAVRGAQGKDRFSGYPYLRGTKALTPNLDALVPPDPNEEQMAPQRGDRYRVTYDSKHQGQHYLKIERKVKDQTQYQQILLLNDAELKQQKLPENLYLSLTAATGSDRNNHEIDNFSVCSDVIKPIGEQVHHFEFSYSSPLTCSAEKIFIKACKTASCQEPDGIFKDPLTAILSAPNSKGAYWVKGDKVTFTNGYADVYLRSLTLDPVTLEINSSFPSTVAGSNTLCKGNIAGFTELNQKNCTFSFAQSGLLIHVPDEYANKGVVGTVKAVRSSNNALECVPEFANVNKNIKFWSQYDTPVFESPSISLADKSQTKLTAVSKSEANSTPITLHFDSKGIATFNLNYPDAGKLWLHGRYDGSSEDNDKHLVMIGSTSFISSPVGLCVKPEKICQAGDHTCPVFKKAGEPFKLSITPMAWQKDNDNNYCDNGITTPSYAESSIQLTSKVIAPKNGDDGQLAKTNYDHKSALAHNDKEVLKDGTNIIDQSISEVGVFTFHATAGNYLGSNLAIGEGISKPTGRFVPAQFEVSGNIYPACSKGKFSYMSQPFEISIRAEAKNETNKITQNYFGAFAKATDELSAEANHTNYSDRLSPSSIITATNWKNGVANANLKKVSFNRLLTTDVDGPFPKMNIGIVINDNDGNYAKTTGKGKTINGNAITIDQPQNIRFGRIVMDNVYGSENEILSMPTYAQYWAGQEKGWQVNELDTCTSFGANTEDIHSSLASQTDKVEEGYKFDPPINPDGNQSVARSGKGKFNAGKFELEWQSFGHPKYRGKVTAPLDVPDWLKYYWHWNDKINKNNTENENPRASAYFGSYRGNDKIIYWNEEY